MPRVRARRRPVRRPDRRPRVSAARRAHAHHQGAGRVRRARAQRTVAVGRRRGGDQLHTAARLPGQVSGSARGRQADEDAGRPGRDEDHTQGHDRRGAGARREAGRPGGEVGGAELPEQGVLQDGEEDERLL